MKFFLMFAGRHGTVVVVAGIAIGLIIPLFADLARPYLAFAMFAFSYGAFLKFDSKAFDAEIKHGKRNVILLLWLTLGIPALIILLLRAVDFGPDLTQGLLFWSLTPASGACIAFAAMLGLNLSLTLIMVASATALSPIYIPVLSAMAGGYELNADPVDMCIRLFIIVGGAGVAAFLTKRFASTYVQENPQAVTGISVVALFIAGLGSMKGMQAHLVGDTVSTLQMIGLGFSVLIVMQVLGTLLFWNCGRTAALSAGLMSGTRTITMAWVLLGDDILPLANIFFGAYMIAKYCGPALTKPLITHLLNPKATQLILDRR